MASEQSLNVLFPNFVDFLLKNSYLNSNKDTRKVDSNLENYLKHHLTGFRDSLKKRRQSLHSHSSKSLSINRRSMSRIAQVATPKNRGNGGESQIIGSQSGSNFLIKKNTIRDNYKMDEREDSDTFSKLSTLDQDWRDSEDCVVLEDFNETLLEPEIFEKNSLLEYLKQSAFDFSLTSFFFFEKTLEGLQKSAKGRDLNEFVKRHALKGSVGESGESETSLKDLDRSRRRGLSHKMFNISIIHEGGSKEESKRRKKVESQYFIKDIRNQLKKRVIKKNLLFDLPCRPRTLGKKYKFDIGGSFGYG